MACAGGAGIHGLERTLIETANAIACAHIDRMSELRKSAPVYADARRHPSLCHVLLVRAGTSKQCGSDNDVLASHTQQRLTQHGRCYIAACPLVHARFCSIHQYKQQQLAQQQQAQQQQDSREQTHLALLQLLHQGLTPERDAIRQVSDISAMSDVGGVSDVGGASGGAAAVRAAVCTLRCHLERRTCICTAK
jgi:hypothetical protein